MAKLKTTSIKNATSVLDLVQDNDEFTTGLFTGFLNKELPSDHILDIFGLVGSDSFVKSVTLSDDDKRKYRSNPSLLAYDLYGSIDYANIILYINNIAHPGEFDTDKPINILMNSSIKTLISLYKQMIKRVG